MAIFFLYILTFVLFGSTWIAVKIGLSSFPPITGAVLRCIIAFILFGLLFRLWRFRFPQVKNIKRDFFTAGFVMYGLSLALIYWGQTRISSSLSAVIYATMPFFTAICARYMLPGERLTFRIVLGQVIGFSGTILLFSDDLSLSGSFWGMAALLISSFACSWATVKVKRDLHQIDPKVIATLQLPAGLLVLIPCMLIFELPLHLHYDIKGIAALFYLVIFGTGLAFILWYYLLTKISPTKLSLMTFLEPLVAILLGYLILDESLTGRMIVGGAMILFGVLLVTLAPTVSEKNENIDNKLRIN